MLASFEEWDLWGWGEPGAYYCPPLHANADVAIMERVEEALEQCGPLQGEAGHEEGKAHAAEAVPL